MVKEKWKSPKLVVLVRGEPEEHVLAACKYTQAGPSGVWETCAQSTSNQSCSGGITSATPGGLQCGACSGVSPS